jgi:hypothetical protein
LEIKQDNLLLFLSLLFTLEKNSNTSGAQRDESFILVESEIKCGMGQTNQIISFAMLFCSIFTYHL